MEKQLQKDICKTKASFLSESMAYEVISFNKLNGIQEVYKCNYCNSYHITTINKKKKKKADASRKKKDVELREHFLRIGINKKLGHKKRKDY